MLDEMEKERSINGLQKPCEGLHRDELPVNSYTQLDETEECLVDCHMTGRTVGGTNRGVNKIINTIMFNAVLARNIYTSMSTGALHA